MTNNRDPRSILAEYVLLDDVPSAKIYGVAAELATALRSTIAERDLFYVTNVSLEQERFSLRASLTEAEAECHRKSCVTLYADRSQLESERDSLKAENTRLYKIVDADVDIDALKARCSKLEEQKAVWRVMCERYEKALRKLTEAHNAQGYREERCECYAHQEAREALRESGTEKGEKT